MLNCRPIMCLVEKGDKLRVAAVDRWPRVVNFPGKHGEPVAWEPGRLAARAGGVEVYRSEAMELRAGDRIRRTRIDTGLGLVNNQTAEVADVRGAMVSFRLEDGRMLDFQGGDAELRHVDRAWASTVHVFQGRTVDTMIAAMGANPPNLTHHEDPLRRDQPNERPRGARYRRQGGAQGTARSRHG